MERHFCDHTLSHETELLRTLLALLQALSCPSRESEQERKAPGVGSWQVTAGSMVACLVLCRRDKGKRKLEAGKKALPAGIRVTVNFLLWEFGHATHASESLGFLLACQMELVRSALRFATKTEVMDASVEPLPVSRGCLLLSPLLYGADLC